MTNMTEVMDGVTVKGYELKERIGSGGFGGSGCINGVAKFDRGRVQAVPPCRDLSAWAMGTAAVSPSFLGET